LVLGPDTNVGCGMSVEGVLVRIGLVESWLIRLVDAAMRKEINIF
jgi:hypothetical protein